METKKCLTCGAEIDVNAVHCPSCGAVRGRKKPMPNTHLAWAIFTTIFCCLFTGIISIIYAAQVSKAYQQGDIVGAYHKSKMADRWANVGFLLFWLPVIIYIIMTIAGFSFGVVTDFVNGGLHSIGIK